MSFRLLVTLSLGLVGMVALVRATEQPRPVQQTGPESIAQLRDDLILKHEQLTTELDQLADDLKKSKLTNVTEVKELKERSVRLTTKLQELIAMFSEDPRLRQLNEEVQALKAFLAKVDILLKKEKMTQAQTEAGK